MASAGYYLLVKALERSRDGSAVAIPPMHREVRLQLMQRPLIELVDVSDDLPADGLASAFTLGAHCACMAIACARRWLISATHTGP
jgi:hypothetical protein